MKTVLITGCSKGIGKETALLFQKNGWNVAATMRNPEQATDLNALDRINCYQMDVTDVASIEVCKCKILEDFGEVDVLINNAGVYFTKPLEMTTEKDIDSIMQTNVIGTLKVMQAFIPYFRQRKAGIIINLSSIAGKSTFPFQSLYHATKYAVEGMSEGLWYEMQPLGIAVKVVEPGMVHTDLYDKSIEPSTENYPEEYKTRYINWHRYLMGQYKTGTSPYKTAEIIFKAATDGKKKLRYSSGTDAKVLFTIRALFPFPLLQKIICRVTGNL
jgi:NADP-dependent 3-hydroxy acid dehydrogenase YdfG